MAVTWDYWPGVGGGGEGRFVGVVERWDESPDGVFFTLRDKHGVILDQYTPLCKEVKRVR